VECIDTTGNSVGEALALLSQAAVCVGGDTGLVHAARALGTPTVALFGQTGSQRHAFSPRSRPVSLDIECSPCSAHGQDRCPLGHHRCLRNLDVDRVLDACEAVIA
jgi:heptosyltransferase-2